MADGNELLMVNLIFSQLFLNLFCILAEEIIRRRLLFDGEGTGDERRLNVLLKTFLTWCNAEDTPEET